MSRKALDWVYSLSPELEMKSSTAFVLFLLAECHNAKTGACYPSYDTLAKRGRFARITAIRAVTELIELGLVQKSERFRSGKPQPTNQYDLMIGCDPTQSNTSDTLSKEVQGNIHETLSETAQGNIYDSHRVTPVIPEHKRRGTGAQNSDVIDIDETF